MEYTTEIELNSGQRPSRRRTSNWHSLSTNSPCFQPVMCCPSSAPEKGWCLPWPFRGCESVLLGPQRLPLTLTLRHLPRFRCLLCGATFGVLGILHPRLHGETRGFHSVPWRPTEGGVHQPWYQATLRVGVECWLVPGSGVTHTPSVVVWAEVVSTLATWQPSASESQNRASTSISRAAWCRSVLKIPSSGALVHRWLAAASSRPLTRPTASSTASFMEAASIFCCSLIRRPPSRPRC